MDNSKVRLIQANVGLIVFVVGVVLVLVSQTFEAHWAKVSVDGVMATIGSGIIFSGALQWLFDTFSKPQLFRDIAEHTLQNSRLASSGLADCSFNSKDVDYSRVIESGDDLVLAVSYSPRLLEDYYESFKKRLMAGRDVTIVVLDEGSIGYRYATDGDAESGHILPNLRKIERCASELARYGTVKLVRHDQILKYSFVATKQKIWLTLYKNSRGIGTVPAFCVSSPSRLFDFLIADINGVSGCPT